VHVEYIICTRPDQASIRHLMGGRQGRKYRKRVAGRGCNMRGDAGSARLFGRFHTGRMTCRDIRKEEGSVIGEVAMRSQKNNHTEEEGKNPKQEAEITSSSKEGTLNFEPVRIPRTCQRENKKQRRGGEEYRHKNIMENLISV